jgi:hypothetical protein
MVMKKRRRRKSSVLLPILLAITDCDFTSWFDESGNTH